MALKVLLSLYDHSGNQSKPYLENGWTVKQVEIKHGIDILTWDYKEYFRSLLQHGNYIEKIGIICPTPCTDYAISGAKHFAQKDIDGRTAASQLLVAKNKEIIDYCKSTGLLDFWYIENPMSRIHTLNHWLGAVKYKFNPCDFSGYFIDIEENELIKSARLKNDFKDLSKLELQSLFNYNLYNKSTWLWGEFNHPTKKRVEPIFKDNPGFKLYGGKSERTKELRSVTPLGFCYAFYEANH